MAAAAPSAVQAIRGYVTKMIGSVGGMKVLVLDKQTVSVVISWTCSNEE